MFFKLPWFKSKSPSQQVTQVLEMELDFLVDEFQEAMADVEDPPRMRLRAALMCCQSPRDLWFLRGKLHQLISLHHCERVANERLSRLDQKMRFFVENHPDYEPEDLPTRPMVLLN
jgi:hypothetical protein